MAKAKASSILLALVGLAFLVPSAIICYKCMMHQLENGNKIGAEAGLLMNRRIPLDCRYAEGNVWSFVLGCFEGMEENDPLRKLLAQQPFFALVADGLHLNSQGRLNINKLTSIDTLQKYDCIRIFHSARQGNVEYELVAYVDSSDSIDSFGIQKIPLTVEEPRGIAVLVEGADLLIVVEDQEPGRFYVELENMNSSCKIGFAPAKNTAAGEVEFSDFLPNKIYECRALAGTANPQDQILSVLLIAEDQPQPRAIGTLRTRRKRDFENVKHLAVSANVFQQRYTISNELACPICLDLIDFVLDREIAVFHSNVLDANHAHILHVHCASDWMKRSNTCPICQTLAT